MKRRPLCLNGSLDDLSIWDVLQVLSLGRKTGYLTLETRVGAGVIVFREGRVVASIAEGDGGPVAVAAVTSLSQAERDAYIRERITVLLHRFARCRQGEFDFQASTQSLLVIQGRDVAQEELGSGIDVIELLIEMACRLGGGELQEPHPGPGAEPSVLLVDDEAVVRRLLSRYLAAGGYRVVEAGDIESAVRRGKGLAGAGVPFVLLTDLNMPGASGNSFRGGIEVVKRLAGLRIRPPVVMMADSESWARSVRSMRGISTVVLKPGLSKLDPEEFEADIRALAGRMVQEVLPQVCGASSA